MVKRLSRADMEDEEDDSDRAQLSPLTLRKELEERHCQCDEDDGYEEEDLVLPPPPDGGWGWVVCIASFLCNMILDGIAYSFGVLLGPLCRYFNEDAGTVSWVGSLLCGVYLMSGPIVGGLVNKFGCRPVCMAGSVITCLAFSLSTLSPNVPVLMLTYGLLGGFGLGLIYLPAVVAVGYYFEKKRALATGISVCGSGVGTFIFAPLSNYLLENYGWKGANLIFAALCLQCAVFGALMRPLTVSVLVMEQDEEGEKCTLKLPDGTIKQTLKTDVSEQTSLASFDQIHASLSTHKMNSGLATITEKQVATNFKETEANKNSHLKDDIGSKQLLTKRTGRLRTVSENEKAKKPLSPVTVTVSPTKESKIPRNQSAPHFVLNARNMSTTFIPLSRVNSVVRYSIGSGSQLHVGDPDKLRSSQMLVRPLSRKDIFYSRSIYSVHQPDNNDADLNLKKSQVSLGKPGLRSNKASYISMNSGLRSNRASFVSIKRGSLVNSNLGLPIKSEDKRMSVVGGGQGDQGEKGGMLDVLKEMMNFKLLADPLFLLIGISNVFGMIGFYTPFVYLPNMASQFDNISPDEAAVLISVIGVSNTVGRVLSGWLSDFPWVNSLVVTNIAIILSAVSVFLFPFCTSYGAFVTMALLFGFFVAAYISLSSIVLVDLLGLDNLTSAFGLLTLFRGSSSMIGPPINGMIFEATQTYSFSFYVSAGFLLVAGLVSCLVDILKRRRDKELKCGGNRNY